jgi:hypothetical protein
MKKLALGLVLGSLIVSMNGYAAPATRTISSEGQICNGTGDICTTSYLGFGTVTQKVTVFEDKKRGVVCYITHGSIKGSVPQEANETNPAISCLKF